VAADINRLLVEWSEAGLLDTVTADRIRAFEHERAGSARLRAPILIAVALGGVLLGAGVLLFVAAHWEALAPSSRFALDRKSVV